MTSDPTLVEEGYCPANLESFSIASSDPRSGHRVAAWCDVPRANVHLELTEISRSYARFVPRKFLEQLRKERILDVAFGDQVQRGHDGAICRHP